MRVKIFLLAFLFLSIFGSAQFLHPTTGINSEYVGACETATCSGTYLDDGNGGNYSANISSTYRVFCPNTAGNCVRLTFTSFAAEGQVNPFGPLPLDCYYDYLTVGNGPTQNSTVFTTAPATATGRICATPATPFSYTSTDASGCLTVRFTSDGTNNFAGWSANISCVACGGGPTGTTNSDCSFATALCNNAGVAANSTGPGIKAEGCTGAACPAGGENFSNWYQVLINTGGTLNFTVSPSVGTSDFDFAIFGPNPTCAALGAPIRCSDSGLTGNTGLRATSVDNTEDVNGDSWCATLNVVAGQTYFIVVDSWSPPTGNYNLNFGGTSTFNCAVLPVEMISFAAAYNIKDKQSELRWVTSRERDIDYYQIERSTDAYYFKEINRVNPYNASSNTNNHYFTADPNPVSGEINYYRIITVDKKGNKSLSNMQAVMFQDDDANLHVSPNPAYDNLNVSFKSNRNQTWIISAISSKGELVKKMEYSAQKDGINELQLRLTELNSGMYFVTISNGNDTYKRKFVKE